MKKLLPILLLCCASCNNEPKTEAIVQVKEDITKDSIKYTVDFLNSLDWTDEEIQHLDSLTDNLVCRNAERDLDTVINHVKVKFITNE